jgi:hypothetical protein
VAAPNRTGSCFIVRSAMQIDRSAGHVCEVDMWSHGDISLPDFAQAQANAHLIDTAPDLYAELRAAKTELRMAITLRDTFGGLAGGGPCPFRERIKAIDAALARAVRS